MLDTDLPYLDPLLFHLRSDETLKKYFTDKSFFMPKTDMINAVDEAIQQSCPMPRALWILPQDTVSVNSRAGCVSQGNHTFFIQLITKCIKHEFQISKKDDELYLSGDFMELAQIRKAVKKSMVSFSRKALENTYQYKNLVWVKDQMLYPDQADGFFVVTLEYSVII